jgi:hypothetical protein
MSKQTKTNTTTFRKKAQKRRSGIHSKKKSSNLKSSKNWKKPYRGQGK